MNRISKVILFWHHCFGNRYGFCEMNKGLIHYIIYTRDKNLPKERSVSDVNSPKLVGIDPVRWLLVGGQIYNFKSVKSIISNFKPAKLYFEKNLTYFQIFSSGCSSSLTSHYEHCTWMKEARSIRTNDWTMKDVFGIKRVNLCGEGSSSSPSGLSSKKMADWELLEVMSLVLMLSLLIRLSLNSHPLGQSLQGWCRCFGSNVVGGEECTIGKLSMAILSITTIPLPQTLPPTIPSHPFSLTTNPTENFMMILLQNSYLISKRKQPQMMLQMSQNLFPLTINLIGNLMMMIQKQIAKNNHTIMTTLTFWNN